MCEAQTWPNDGLQNYTFCSVHSTQPSTMDKLFGSADLMLLGQDGAKTPVSTLAGKQVVGIYFSAHWCPPSWLGSLFLKLVSGLAL